MRLQNTLAHAAGSKVMVNGTIYEIDKDGFADIADEANAKKLLGAAYWRVAGATAAPAAKPVVRAEVKPMKLLSAEGKPIELAPPPAPPVVVDPTVDPPIPPKGATWADPLPTYSMDWLTRCAKAYKVKLPKKVTRQQLCELILEQMYDK